jgi:hypothetical protein
LDSCGRVTSTRLPNHDAGHLEPGELREQLDRGPTEQPRDLLDAGPGEQRLEPRADGAGTATGQLLHEPGHVDHDRRTFGQQTEATLGLRCRDGARHRVHRAIRLQREPRGDGGTTALGSLHDHDGARQAGDPSVADRERVRARRDLVVEASDERPSTREDLLSEPPVRCRCRVQQPVPEDRDGAPSLERAAVRGRIDPARQPTHDDLPGRSECNAQVARHATPVRRTLARSHHRHAAVDAGDRALDEQHGWRPR